MNDELKITNYEWMMMNTERTRSGGLSDWLGNRTHLIPDLKRELSLFSLEQLNFFALVIFVNIIIMLNGIGAPILSAATRAGCKRKLLKR